MAVDPLAPLAGAGPTPAPPPADAKTVKAARDFEAVFAGEVAKRLLESVEINEEFGGGHGEEMFRGVLAETLGQAMAERGGLGLSSAVLAQLVRLQQGGGQ